MRKTFFLLLVCFVSAATAGAQVPDFRVELTKAGDRVAVTSVGDTREMTVTSESGIGSAKLIRTGASWPLRVKIRLGLRGLESFWMQNGSIHFETFLQNRGRVPYSRIDDNGKTQNTRAGVLDVAMSRTEKTVDITVPKEIFGGNPSEITVGWVDFYRR